MNKLKFITYQVFASVHDFQLSHRVDWDMLTVVVVLRESPESKR